jgi:hypothetical protein
LIRTGHLVFRTSSHPEGFVSRGRESRPAQQVLCNVRKIKRMGRAQRFHQVNCVLNESRTRFLNNARQSPKQTKTYISRPNCGSTHPFICYLESTQPFSSGNEPAATYIASRRDFRKPVVRRNIAQRGNAP